MQDIICPIDDRNCGSDCMFYPDKCSELKHITKERKLKMNDEKVNKLLDLHKRLREVKAMRKSMAEDYKDQIKEIEKEIDDLIKEMEEDKKKGG